MDKALPWTSLGELTKLLQITLTGFRKEGEGRKGDSNKEEK